MRIGPHQIAPALGLAPMAGVGEILIEHLEALHADGGEDRGVRIARKHQGWYAKAHPGSEAFLCAVNWIECAAL